MKPWWKQDAGNSIKNPIDIKRYRTRVINMGVLRQYRLKISALQIREADISDLRRCTELTVRRA
ncbi:MAG: hypothetical protein R3C68_00540 [Myxococcota bacterium]